MTARNGNAGKTRKKEIRRAHFMTCEALHSVPILSLEEVDDEAVIAHAVDLPLLFARDLCRHLLELGFPFRRRLDVPLLQDPVQVLVQAVQQEAQELLRVVLLRARELRRMAAYRSLRAEIPPER